MGDVKNEADTARMREILADIDSSGGGGGGMGGAPESRGPPPPMDPREVGIPQRMQPMPPMMQMPMHMGPPMMQYEEEQHPKYKPVAVAAPPKKNTWSVVFEMIRDPIFVALLIFGLSLPALHTLVGKHAAWAYKVSGQLSWAGLAVFSIVGALVFALYRSAIQMIA